VSSEFGIGPAVTRKVHNKGLGSSERLLGTPGGDPRLDVDDHVPRGLNTRLSDPFCSMDKVKLGSEPDGER
jgi:hypothetical protein